MKIKNLIVGGCSFTAGCGFEKESYGDKDDTADFTFAHDGLKKYFLEPFNIGNVRKQIEQLMYPALLGKKLKVENTKNLAVGGMGYPIHTRRIFSYLLDPRNRDLLNKETLVLLQLTSLQRAELPHPRDNNLIEYCYLGNNEGDDSAQDYLLKHYNPYYLILKGIYELSLFQGWCKSVGVNVFFLDFFRWREEWSGDMKDKLPTFDSINQHQYNLHHGNIPFPYHKELLRDMDTIDINFTHSSFETMGYHDDPHWVPEDHEIIATHIFDKLQEKFEINLDN